MSGRTARRSAVAAACLAASLGAAGPAQAQQLSPGCINGPLYVPYFTDRMLGNEAGVLCGVFGNKAHTIKIELMGPNGFYSTRSATWFPGQYPWYIVNSAAHQVNWGTPGFPSRWNSCVTAQPYDSASWFKRCIAIQTYRRSTGSVAIVRSPAQDSHKFK